MLREENAGLKRELEGLRIESTWMQEALENTLDITKEIISWASSCSCLTAEEACAPSGRTCPTCLAKSILDILAPPASQEKT